MRRTEIGPEYLDTLIGLFGHGIRELKLSIFKPWLPTALFRDNLRLLRQMTIDGVSEINIHDLIQLCNTKAKGFFLDLKTIIKVEDFIRLIEECPHIFIKVETIIVPENFKIK